MSMPGRRHPGGTGAIPTLLTFTTERQSDADLDIGTPYDPGPLTIARDLQCHRCAVWLRLWVWGAPLPVSTPRVCHRAWRRRRQRTAHPAVRGVCRCGGALS